MAIVIRLLWASRQRRMALSLCALVASMVTSTAALAQTVLLDQVHTIAAQDQGVPVEHDFTVATAGTYQVQLTDLGKAATPSAPLTSLKLAITRGSTIVGAPLTGEGTMVFTAAAGAYVVRVIGAPGPVVGSGPFGVQITNVADSSQLVSFSDTLASPAASAANVGVLNDTFTVAVGGTFTVTLTDQQFPQALNTVQLALTQAGGGLIAALTATTPSASVTLQPGTAYDVFAFGQASSAANAGLYSVVVRDSNNAVVYSRTLAVGSVKSLGAVTLAAGGYILIYNDLTVPAALSASGPNGAIIALDDQVAARLSTPGSNAFTASNGSYQVFALGTAAATPGAGSYDVEVLPVSGTAALSVAQAVTVAGSATQAYTFSTNVAAAGGYHVQLTDFQLPAALTSVTMAAVQAGVSLANPLTAAGTLNINAAAGNVSILVFAQVPTGGGVFGLAVTPGTGGNPIFETTQGIGGVFTSLQAHVTSAGNYVANVTDVGFPAQFATLYVLVTHGPTLVGSIFGGGALPFAATSSGDYFITFTAQPSTSDEAGTYAINVGSAPPAPAVSLTSSVSHLASGGSATLTWSSQNATSCTASGGWSGPEPVSGNTSTGALTADTTFMLGCTGSGGTTTRSVTITIDQPTSGGGGGGSFGLIDLLLLAGLLVVRALSNDGSARDVQRQGQTARVMQQ